MSRWGSVRSRRFVLPAETGYDTVAELADNVGAQKIRDAWPNPAAGQAREVTWQLSSDDFLHYGLDGPTRRGYVQVTGSEDESVAEFSGIVAQYFDVVDDEVLLAAVDAADSDEDRRAALIVLGMGAPGAVDSRFVDRLEQGLHAPDEGVREGALYGAAYTLWPPLMESVGRMATDDPEEVIRRQAQALTDWVRENGERS